MNFALQSSILVVKFILKLEWQNRYYKQEQLMFLCILQLNVALIIIIFDGITDSTDLQLFVDWTVFYMLNVNDGLKILFPVWLDGNKFWQPALQWS